MGQTSTTCLRQYQSIKFIWKSITLVNYTSLISNGEKKNRRLYIDVSKQIKTAPRFVTDVFCDDNSPFGFESVLFVGGPNFENL